MELIFNFVVKKRKNYENNIRVGIWKKYNKRGLEISQDSYDK